MYDGKAQEVPDTKIFFENEYRQYAMARLNADQIT